MHPIDVIRKLSTTRSRIEKEHILTDAYLQGCDSFFIGARLALDPLVPFHIAKVPEILEDDGAAGEFSFADFLDLANRLHRRALTGHAARDALHGAAERCHVATWNEFYRRILLKDLRVGVDEKTLNKVLKALPPEAHKFMVPIFKCQLAHDGEDPVHQKKLHGRKLLDVKLDGVRVLVVMDKDSGSVTLFSRNGLMIQNFPELQTALAGLLPRLPGSLVLDGEMESPQGFQHLMTLIRRKDYHPEMAQVRYAMFDVIPLGDFRHAYCPKTQQERHQVLEALQQIGLWTETAGRVYVIPQVEVDLDSSDGQAAFTEFNRQALFDGYEGIMVKDPMAPYVGKRTAAWLKLKPVIDVTLEIIGFEPGDVDSKYKDTLGAVVCRGNDAGKLIESKVAGMSDEMRDEIWRHQDDYRGRLIDIRADRVTLEEGADVYSLRFPRWKGFRGRDHEGKL